MKKKKLLAGLLITTGLVWWIGATFANDSNNSQAKRTWKEFWRGYMMSGENIALMTEMKEIFNKKHKGETLTADEQSKLTEMQAKMWQKREWNRFWWKMFWRWSYWQRFMGNNLTDAEKTALEKMTDAEKTAFIEKKKEDQKIKMEAHQNVIDKVLSWKSLTSKEEITKNEIIKQRALKKGQKNEMQSKMNEIKPILEKKRNWITLTADEQTKLDTLWKSRWQWNRFAWWNR